MCGRCGLARFIAMDCSRLRPAANQQWCSRRNTLELLATERATTGLPQEYPTRSPALACSVLAEANTGMRQHSVQLAHGGCRCAVPDIDTPKTFWLPEEGGGVGAEERGSRRGGGAEGAGEPRCGPNTYLKMIPSLRSSFSTHMCGGFRKKFWP